MRVYHDQDADSNILEGRQIAVIGYGNQDRAQAPNLHDSGLEVIVGNREDDYAARTRKMDFASILSGRPRPRPMFVMLLIPDEVAPTVFEGEVTPI